MAQNNQRIKEILEHFKEYLESEEAKKHLQTMENEKNEVKEIMQKLSKMDKKSLEFTDLVLYGLLPYSKTSVAKRVSLFPAFMNIRLFFGDYKYSEQEWNLLANKIYTPSYISLEFALSYNGVIPETVYEITSVTTKTTRRFEALGKVFSYRKIKRVAYTGYEIQKQKGLSFNIADAEKAFVDTNYLRLMNRQKPISRFNKEKINSEKALRYAKLFDNIKLIGIIKSTLR